MGVQVSLQDPFSTGWDTYPQVELLAHMVILFLIFLGNAILFSIVATLFYIPTNNAHVFCYFSTTLPTLVTFCLVFFFFDSGHPNGYEVISCSFDLHFSNN